MKQLLLTFLFISLSAFAIFAQDQYSYLSDARFIKMEDFVGYNFVPRYKEIPEEGEEELSPGDYSFGLSTQKLYIKGEGIKGVYDIKEFQKTQYGYKLKVINSVDARLQGHLKIIINKYYETEALVFKRSPSEQEIIFYMSLIPKERRLKEKAFFTNWGQLGYIKQDSLWFTEIHPFSKIFRDEKVNKRLNIDDSTTISFVVDTIVDTKIKTKKLKQLNEISPDSTVEEVVIDTTLKVNTTIIHKIIETGYIDFSDGTRSLETKEYIVKPEAVKYTIEGGPNVYGEKYFWEFKHKGKETLRLFFTNENKVSSFRLGNHHYRVRGF